MLSVYDGRTCIGFVLTRHWVNGYAVTYEALSTDEKSLGLYLSQAEAANACSRAAHDHAGRAR
jgi:hypothetical protein